MRGKEGECRVCGKKGLVWEVWVCQECLGAVCKEHLEKRHNRRAPIELRKFFIPIQV